MLKEGFCCSVIAFYSSDLFFRKIIKTALFQAKLNNSKPVSLYNLSMSSCAFKIFLFKSFC